jgi:hypothetical protein
LLPIFEETSAPNSEEKKEIGTPWSVNLSSEELIHEENRSKDSRESEGGAVEIQPAEVESDL